MSTNGKTASSATNGHRPGKKIRVAIVGVGNCASSLVQGRYYYENASETDFVPGLMHVNLGGYHVRDIEFVAAFDIDKNKVGKDLSEAIYAKPNNTFVFQQVPKLDIRVERGMTHDESAWCLLDSAHDGWRGRPVDPAFSDDQVASLQ